MAAFQKQYEAYLLRVYANRQPPGSVTGDSGIASQHEDKYPRKTVVVDTRNVSSPRTHPTAPPARSNQPTFTFTTGKLHEQVPIDDVSAVTYPILPASSGTTRDIDYHQASVPRTPQVHASSRDQLVHRASSAFDTRYPQVASSFEENALPSDRQNVPNRVPHVIAPASTAYQAAQPDNRFYREHVESAQAASGLPMIVQLPADDATRCAQGESVPRQFDPAASSRYYDTSGADPQSRMKTKYDTYDVAAPMWPDSMIAAKSGTVCSRKLRPEASADQLGSLPGYMDYTSPRKSEDEGSIRSLTSDDVDNLIRRNERLLWRNMDVDKMGRSSIMLAGNDADLDAENSRMTALLENELDRYISNIRKLHREHGVQSLDELDHEQNTSGDLLNVSLSEDAVELPVEDRRDKKERIPEEMSKILALVNDLVAKTAYSHEVANSPAVRIGGSVSSAEAEDRHRDVEGISVRNEIGKEDAATYSMELKQSREDAKGKSDRVESSELRERDHEVSAAEENAAMDETVGSSNGKSRIDDAQGRENASQERQFDPVVGEESNIDEQLFDVAEQLAPWDVASVQKQILELHLDNSERDRETEAAEDTANRSDEVAEKSCDSPSLVDEQSDAGNGKVEKPVYPPRDTLLRSEVEASRDSNASKSHGRDEETGNAFPEIATNVEETKESIKTDVLLQREEELGEPNENDGETRNGNEMAEARVDEERIVERDDQYSGQQGYIENPSRADTQYAQQDPNEGYNEQNTAYESTTGNEEYKRYADGGYAQEGEQYVEYVDGQYEQYDPEDANGSRYQHDPNVQYDQAYAYDPNYDPNYDGDREYAVDSNQQYDPNQGYGDDPNQAYGYTEQTYDPDQTTYDKNLYEQGYEEERREGNDVANVEDPAEKPEPEAIVQSRQTDSLSGHKSDDDDDGKPGQTGVVANGTNRSKKKKDVIKSLLDSDTDTTIERNVSNTESDFDFN